MKANKEEIEEVIAEQLNVESVHGDITLNIDHINIIDRSGELVEQLDLADEDTDGGTTTVTCETFDYCGLCGGDLEGENEVITGVCNVCTDDSVVTDGGWNTGGEPEPAIQRMNEFQEARENVRQLRKNAMEMDDQIEDMKWVAAGGRGSHIPERWDRLITASRRICEDLEDMDVPDPWEIRSND